MKEKKRLELKIIIAFSIIAIAILLGCFIYFLQDNIKFTKEYSQVDKNNLFKYATQEEILDGFKSTSVIFFGFKECKWCQGYAPILNDIAAKNGVEEILYYNIKEDRTNKSDFYNQVVEIVKEYLDKDSEGNLKIFVPDTYFVKNGEIIGHSTDSEQKEEIENLIKQVINCDDGHGGC